MDRKQGVPQKIAQRLGFGRAIMLAGLLVLAACEGAKSVVGDAPGPPDAYQPQLETPNGHG